MSQHICSTKLLVVAKESKNIQPGNADLERKRVNVLMCKFVVSGASPQGRMFLEILHTQPVLGSLVSSVSNFWLEIPIRE
jgi:hypothetical protein